MIHCVLKSGCSIPVVRAHGVGVDRVQFPAPRPVDARVSSKKDGVKFLLKFAPKLSAMYTPARFFFVQNPR